MDKSIDEVKRNSSEIELKEIKCNRFHVEMVKGMDNSPEEKDAEKTESGYVKNMRYLTREALPRLDNYRHIMSIQAAYRPTLDDLHDSVYPNFTENENEIDRYGYNMNSKHRMEFGWVQGVFLPNLLSMCSTMLFLRFAWIIVQTGLVEGLLLVAFAGAVNLITALSISAISTNGLIKEGGSYMMMSRSLGPEFGVPVGIILLISNIGLCAMYITGLMEYIVNISGFCWLDCAALDTRNFSTVILFAFIVIAIICFFYSNIAFACIKSQFVLFAVMLAAMIDFVAGIIIGPLDSVGKNSFSSFSVSVLQENLFAKYPDEKNEEYNLFFSLFAVFYPALSEFLTGVTCSGYLKDPLKAIPKGTVLSIFFCILIYSFVAIMLSGTIIHGGYVATTLNNVTMVPIVPMCSDHRCYTKLYDLHYLVESLSREKYIIRIATIASAIYCIFTNCITAITSFKVLCTDALYPKSLWFKTKITTKTAQAYMFTIIIAVAFILPGSLNLIAPLVSILLLVAYALINFSTFHISLIHPVGWRPTFKIYSMWLSLIGSVLCVSIMFLINWIVALITVIIVLALYLAVSYQKPDVNWGSSTQAQTYNSALLSVQTLSHVEDHVKNYRPQVLVLSGLPSHRPPLVTFAHLLTKNLSLMICGHIHSKTISYRERQVFARKAQNWLDFHQMKAFYTQVDDVNFEDGAKLLMQATGLGKLKPNILLMGYKHNWTTASKSDLNMYFNVIHKSLDTHLALCILRVNKGLDFSSLQVDHDQLSDTMSQLDQNCKDESCIEVKPVKPPTVENKRVTFLKEYEKSSYLLPNTLKKSNDDLQERTSLKPNSYEDVSVSDIYRSKDGLELSNDMLDRVTQFQGKQKKGTIDVWWLYDDGGLTLLLPHIISTRKNWSTCKLRVFALSSNNDPLEFEQRNMASLLAKFRIDYSDLTVLPDLMRKPQEETVAFYENLIKGFVSYSDLNIPDERIVITEGDLTTMREKTNRHLRLRELLLEHSQDANLIIMTLPIPRKNVVSAALYMSWLEALTQGLPPFMLVRGNHTSVLTFYS